MSEILMSSAAAQEQATLIAQANDQLTISASVTFSSNTTVSGNQQAEKSVKQLKRANQKLKHDLSRDIKNIHSIVKSFKRTDEAASQLIEGIDLGE